MNERLLCHAITGRAGGKELIMKVSINCQFIAPLLEFSTHAMSFSIDKVRDIKEGLYRIWCGMNRLGYSGVNTLGDTSAFVIPAGQLLLTWRGKTRMDGVGIVFEFYIAAL